MVLEFLYTQIPAPFGEITLTVAGLVVLWIGFQLGKFRMYLRTKSASKDEHKRHLSIEGDLKNAWEKSKAELEEALAEAKTTNESLEKKLEDYRIKVSGLGVFSFGSAKKRSDILYSLLLENEMLEMLLIKHKNQTSQNELAHIEDRLRDVKKRQRLISQLFDDSNIKSYVEAAVTKELTGEHRPPNSEATKSIANELKPE